MKMYDIQSLPAVRFAHVHQADSYNVVFKELKNIIEIFYIQEGTVTISCCGETFTAEKDDIICSFYDGETYVHTDSYHCHHTVSVGIALNESNGSNALFLPRITKASKDTEEIKDMIDSFIYKPYTYENSTAKEAKCILDLLCKIDEVNRKRETHSLPEISILTEKAKKYIHRNIRTPITQKEVADYLRISPGYLCNVFKKSEGISVIKYINSIKLKNIHNLIQKENMKLYEAASRYGYNDANYVSSLFKKMFGYNITDSPTIPIFNKKG